MALPIISTPTGKRATYYQTEWSIYDRKYFIKDLPIDNLVDIAYSFINVLETGELAFHDPWAAIQNPFVENGVDPQNGWWPEPAAEDLGIFGQFKKLLKDQGKKFNLMLALGGWTLSKYFSDAFSTAERRTTFVNSLSAMLTKYPIFNGISIDWEYLSDDGINYGLEGNSVRKEDGENFILVLQMIREKLPGYTIAMCCNAAPEKAKWPVETTIDLLDELHIMTYDFHDGNWGETTSAHHTNLYHSSHGKWSVDEGVKHYMSRGVPASKIFIGGALYSRGFANTDGIGKPAEGGSLNKSWEQGIVDYKALPWEGSEELWDDEAQAPYALDTTRRNLDSYDNVKSILAKAQYVKDNDLAGIILWESSADFPYTDDRSIMKALHDNLTHG
ncbi:hypothetical protein GOP47_0027968 [Adiantum capillus-veneris]|nr:hypothetical protein GOP47_0027968 [Adiantum capillus-veneris]